MTAEHKPSIAEIFFLKPIQLALFLLYRALTFIPRKIWYGAGGIPSDAPDYHVQS